MPLAPRGVAVVEVHGGEVADSFYTLIKPPGMRFDPVNISIHGITPSMVEKARDFAGVWPELGLLLRYSHGKVR